MLTVGIDVGGTFTDLFAWDATAPAGERIREAKVLSTPIDPSVGFMDALAAAEIDPASIGRIVHGTTIATNALIQRRFPEPALITTDGFRDVIEIGRQRRQRLYDPYQVKAKPLVGRAQRFTVPEKLGADGSTVVPLDREAARAVAEEIAGKGIRNVAIAFINAYQDGRHELEMREILLEVMPDAQVALSSETRPKMRELGRFLTTVVRAALLPAVEAYVDGLQAKLAAAGCTAPLYIIKSNGGTMAAATVRERPEEILASGPAGGVAAGGFIGGLRETPDVIVTDVGGTSFEASLLQDGEGLVTDEYEIEWERPLITPMLDIRSIGAGGGSIAWIDDGGSLRVGPQSAGADPGPACYGRGGTQPTVTDANLVLGRIDPELGGKFRLDEAAARAAIDRVAGPLGLSTDECAEGITRIVAEAMAGAIRMVSTDRGRDPRDYTMVAFGGAGGLHAFDIANTVGMDRVLVPRMAGVACAFGATTMDIRHDVESTFYAPLDGIDIAGLNASYAALEDDVRQRLHDDGIADAAVTVERTALMRYVGQSYEVATPVPDGPIDADSLAALAAAFNDEHRREYGVASDAFPVAIVNLRVTGRGALLDDEGAAALATALRDRSAGADGSVKGQRTAYFDGRSQTIDVHDALRVQAGDRIPGPAIIEQTDGVIVVPSGAVAGADDFSNILVTPNEVVS